MQPFRIRQILIHVISPLLFGLLVYLLCRDPVTKLHFWLGIEKPLIELPPGIFSKFVLFYLPDMCWAYALCASLLILAKIGRLVSATLAIVLLSAVEMAQAQWQFSALDWVDLFSMGIAVLLAILFIRR